MVSQAAKDRAWGALGPYRLKLERDAIARPDFAASVEDVRVTTRPAVEGQREGRNIATRWSREGMGEVMSESVLAKRFGHRTTQEPVVELAPKPTVQATLTSIADARAVIAELREGWPDFVGYSERKAECLAELARQAKEIEANRTIIASLKREIEDTRLEAEHVKEQAKADVTVEQNNLARWRSAAERAQSRAKGGGGW